MISIDETNPRVPTSSLYSYRACSAWLHSTSQCPTPPSAGRSPIPEGRHSVWAYVRTHRQGHGQLDRELVATSGSVNSSLPFLQSIRSLHPTMGTTCTASTSPHPGQHPRAIGLQGMMAWGRPRSPSTMPATAQMRRQLHCWQLTAGGVSGEHSMETAHSTQHGHTDKQRPQWLICKHVVAVRQVRYEAGASLACCNAAVHVCICVCE